MWLRFILSALFFVCLGLVFPGAEVQYRITESQLVSIEASLETLERDRRSWESQARGLRNEAESLNAQLRLEREQYSALETSFNRYEAGQLKALAELEAEKNRAVLERMQEELETRKMKNQRNNLGAALILVLVLIPAFFLVKKFFTRLRL
jgi:outer membrane receptor for ferrienterochelin and colicin